MTEKKASGQEITFKEGLDELERIVALLESGDMELEESLEKYAKGVELLGILQGKLDGAEQRVQVLMGELTAAPEDEVQDSSLSKA